MRRSFPLLVCCGALAWSLQALGEQQEPIRSLFVNPSAAPLRVAAEFLDKASPTSSIPAKQSRFAQMDPQALTYWLDGSLSQPWRCRLNLFPGKEFVGQITAQPSGAEAQCYYGSIEGQPGGQLLLVRKGGAIAASVLLPGRASFVVQPVGDGYFQITELDVDRLLPCGMAGELEANTRGLAHPLAAAAPDQEKGNGTARLGQAPDQEREIEIMVLYTSRARDWAYGTEFIEAQIALAIAEANSVFQNSQTGVHFRLVHTAEIAYNETGELDLDLARLRTPGDGILDEIHALRDDYRADLVCLVVETSKLYSGISALPIGENCGFSVLKRSQLTGYGLMAHELGHNFGCDHDRENAVGGGHNSYSYGHRLDINGQVYRTVMCYAPGLPVAYFSNPDISFQGVPTGVPQGDPQEADNARTIREMAFTIDTYRGVDISISSPTDGAVFREGDNVELAAQPYSEEGEIVKTEFLDGSRCLGQALPPYSTLFWTNVTAGRHVLTASLTVADGMARTSSQVTVMVRPANDDFFNRLELTGSNVLASAVLYAATAEPGEPAPFGQASRTAWWTWTAPASGLTRIGTSGFNRPRAAVFTGEDLAILLLVAKTANVNSDIYFEATADQQYQIVLEGSMDESPASFSLEMESPAPNDQFYDALRIISAVGLVQGRTVGATADAGEPAIGTAPFGHSVWYRWNPTTSGRAQLNLVPTGNSSGLDFAVFTGQALAELKLAANSAQASRGFDVDGQTTYWIGVDGPYGSFNLAVHLAARPANDDFARCIPLPNAAAYLTINNTTATCQPGEPSHGLAGGRSLWWSWQAPSDGGARLTRPAVLGLAPASSFMASGTPPLNVAVYTGSALTSLIRVAGHTFTSPLEESFTFQVRGNTNYFIAVDSDPGIEGSQNLRLDWKMQASNDQFAQRQKISSTPGYVTGTTLGANAEPGEPQHGGAPAAHSLWWSWTFQSPGLIAVTVDSAGKALPFLSIYRGDYLTNLTLVADNVFGNTIGPSVVFAANAGESYQVAIDEPVSSFDCALSVASIPKPPNDDFAARTPISSSFIELQGTTLGASAEPTEPDHAQNGQSHSVWYRWPAQTSGTTTVLAGGRRSSALAKPSGAILLDRFIAVYTGNALSNLTLVAAGLGSATFPAERNVEYQIAVDGCAGSCGDFALNVVAVPDNDCLQKATSLLDGSAWINTTPASLRSATPEAGEPNHGGCATGHSLWWTWTPRQSATYLLCDRQAYVNALFPSSEVVAAVYTGTNVSDLTLVTSNAFVPFRVNAGTRYAIALDLKDARASLASLRASTYLFQLLRQPALLVPRVSQGNSVEFVVAGSAGERLELQVSTDLTTWQLFKTLQYPSTDYSFREWPTSASNAKFYRVAPAE